MSEKPATPPLEDVRFFQQIGADIKMHPDFYREAGEWLDKNYSDKAFCKREEDKWRNLLRKKKKGILTAHERRFLENQRSLPKAKREAGRTSFLKLRRFNEAVQFYARNPPAFPTTTERKRIILMTWLMTDSAADESQLGLTDFERWTWQEPAPERGPLTRQYASDWWLFPSEEYDKWTALARRAWEMLKSAEVTGEIQTGSAPATRSDTDEGNNAVPSPEAGRGDSSKQKRKRREPLMLTSDEKKIVEYYERSSKTQTEVAEELNALRKKGELSDMTWKRFPLTQRKMSAIIKKANKRRAFDKQPQIPTVRRGRRPISMEARKLDLGPRVHEGIGLQQRGQIKWDYDADD